MSPKRLKIYLIYSAVLIWLTSAGTLNFSTTPSSKNMRMPALMRPTSVTGKSLKENRYRFSPLTLSAGGQFALCVDEKSTNDYICLLSDKHKVAVKNSITLNSAKNALFKQNIPTVCTYLSGHSLPVLNQTFLWCSGYKRENGDFISHLHSTH